MFPTVWTSAEQSPTWCWRDADRGTLTDIKESSGSRQKHSLRGIQTFPRNSALTFHYTVRGAPVLKFLFRWPPFESTFPLVAIQCQYSLVFVLWLGWFLSSQPPCILPCAVHSREPVCCWVTLPQPHKHEPFDEIVNEKSFCQLF